MIYRVFADKVNYMYFGFDDRELIKKMPSFNILNLAKGMSFADQWVRPAGKFMVGDEGSAIVPDVSQWIPSSLVLNEKAHTELADILLMCGEVLPVECEGFNYYYFNATDPLDNTFIKQDVSAIQYEDGIWMGVEKLVFDEAKVAALNLPLFKIQYDRGLRLYCSEQFKMVYEKSNLTGLIFSTALV